MAPVLMAPDQPPFPTARYLPFQPEPGSHTSTLMSESGVGWSVAATRQYAGAPTFAITCGGAIVVLGKDSEAKLSHEAASAGSAVASATTICVKRRRITAIRCGRECQFLEPASYLQDLWRCR